MSKDALKAAEDIRSFAARFRGMLALADYLDGVGKLDQMAAEAQKRVEHARAAEQSAIADLEKAHVELANVRAQAEQSKRDALAEAGAIVADARAQASKLTASAKSRAEQTVRDAEDRKTAIDAQVEAQNAILADTTKAVEAAQSRLDSINSEIAAVKERIGA